MIAQTNRIDLHTHSSASDGTDSPRELVANARKLGLRAIALTDHDTVAGVKEALAAGEEYGVEVLPGIEISADYLDTGAHVLGYLVDPDSPALQEVIDWFIQERETRNQAIVDKLAADGYPISIPELKEKFPHTMLGRPHIGQLLMEKGCIGSVQEAMNRWLDDGKPYFVERQHLPMNVVLNYTQILCMTSLVRFCNYAGIICEAAGCSTLGHEGLVIRSLEDPIFMDLGFFFRKGRYLPKLGWELIRFLQAKEQPRLAAWEAQHAQFLNKNTKA